MIDHPISVYINWGAYDELSDTVALTETLALQQLTELLRLRKAGVRFDSYLMDAFWYDPEGGYRTWRKPHWPQGPDRWLDRCLENGIKPGLWFSGNTLCQLKTVPEWVDSLDENGKSLCLFHGGFLPHWMETVRHWYQRGVRVLKLDFFQLSAAPEVVRRNHLPSEIRAMNIAALHHGLSVLRDQCPEIVVLGYNGLEEVGTKHKTDIPIRKTVDHRWLDVFDSLYCGDPRPSDVPAMNFWRSKDVYSDHMVRVYEANGFPLSRIDNAGFMIGKTGTCYGRRTAAWEGMLILSLARGGWVNTYYGNLELLNDEQGAWWAKAQSLFFPLQAFGRFRTFGGIPGEGRPYGYMAEGPEGALLTVVNPSQATETILLPGGSEGRILFHDDGFEPTLREGGLTLGAEQMAVVGTGRYQAPSFDLGRSGDVRIPSSIRPLQVDFNRVNNREVVMTMTPPRDGRVRVVVRQRGPDGRAVRSTGGAPPAGVTLGRLLTLEAEQNGRAIPLQINYDKAIWSGLSWAVGELDVAALVPDVPVRLRGGTSESANVTLDADVFHVMYAIEA